MRTEQRLEPQSISADYLPKALLLGLRGGFHTHILDVRDALGFGRGAVSLPDAIPVPLEGSSWALPDIDRELPILVLTNSDRPSLSRDYGRALLRAGYRHVWVLEGGLNAWINHNRPTTPIQLDRRKLLEPWNVVAAQPGDRKP